MTKTGEIFAPYVRQHMILSNDISQIDISQTIYQNQNISYSVTFLNTYKIKKRSKHLIFLFLLLLPIKSTKQKKKRQYS